MLIGEVWTVDDDETDNIREPIGRFAGVEEDATTTRCPVSAYPCWLR